MKQHKEVKISGHAAHFTTAVSVTLALLTLGIIAMIHIAATIESRRMLEKIEVSVILADSIDDTRALQICSAIEKQPFALDTGSFRASRLCATGRKPPAKTWKRLSA